MRKRIRKGNPRKCIIQKEMHLIGCKKCPYEDICPSEKYTILDLNPCKICAGKYSCKIQDPKHTTCPYD